MTTIRRNYLLPFLPLLLANAQEDPPPGQMPVESLICKPFDCITGYVPVPKETRPKYVSHGCAAMGGSMMFMYGGGDNRQDAFWPCCHQWFACNQVCGANKQYCDLRFRRCSEEKCIGNDKCQQGANLKSMMIEMGGCEKYDAYQSAACTCMQEEKAEARRAEAIRKFYKKYVPDSMDKVEGLSKKVETTSKMTALFIKLLEKYPEAIKYVKDDTMHMYENIDRMMKDQDKKEELEKLLNIEKEEDKHIYDDFDDDEVDEEQVEL